MSRFLDRPDIARLALQAVIFAVIGAIPWVVIYFGKLEPLPILALVVLAGIAFILALLRYVRALILSRRTLLEIVSPDSVAGDVRPRRSRLRMVSMGISLMIPSVALLMLIAVLAIGIRILLMTMADDQQWNEIETMNTWTDSIVSTIRATAVLLATIGSCLCLAAPRQSRASDFAFLSAATNVIAATLLALWAFVPTWGFLASVAAVLPLVGMGVFAFFVRRLGRFLERPDVAKMAMQSVAVGLLAGIIAGAVWIVAQVVDPKTLLPGECIWISLVLVRVVGVGFFLVFAAVSLMRAMQHARKSLQSFAEQHGA